MKRVYPLIYLLCLAAQSSYSQGPCDLKLDSIWLDSSASSCNHLFFKYSYSGGTPNAYHWTYGDGNACGCIKPKNVYNKNGSFQVCGKISDANGCADSLCISVNVFCDDPCDLSEIGIFSFDSLSYSCDEYEFNTITSSNAKNIKWDFGDGQTSSSKFIVHQYKQNGIYKVKLDIQDSIGCGDTAELMVEVNCPPEPEPCDFVISRIDTTASLECHLELFMIISNKPLVHVEWLYGDGDTTINTYKTSAHKYKDNGSYTVCVRAMDSSGCKDTFCRLVTISCPVTSVFSQNASGFSLFPNPVHELLQIESPGSSIFVICDLAGKNIMSGELLEGVNQVDLSLLAKGAYMIRFDDGKGIRYYKILKQ